MKRLLLVFVGFSLIFALAACGDNEEEVEELLELNVDFVVPETAEVGEEVELKAIVTYGDEKVTDAKQMDFEIWERGNEEESETIEAENHEMVRIPFSIPLKMTEFMKCMLIQQHINCTQCLKRK